MKQIKKLARRGMAQTLALLAAIFFGVTAVFGLIMLGEGVEQALMMVVAMDADVRNNHVDLRTDRQRSVSAHRQND